MRFLVILLFAITLASTARADDREARATQSFRRGAAAYAKGDFLVAAQAFEEANTILPAGAALYNAGLAWAGAHEDLRAAVDFAIALDMGLVSAAQIEDAQKRLGELDAKLSAIDVTVPEGTRVEVDSVATDALHVRLQPGDHVVRATFQDGSTAQKTVTLAAGTPSALELVPPPKEAPPPPPKKKEGTNTLLIVGISVTGAAVALAGVGIAVGVAGLGARDDFVKKGKTDASLRDSAVTLETAANVMFIAAGALGAVGLGVITWSIVSKPRAQSASLGFVPGGAFVSGTF